jgi:hypothetical protein
VRIFINRFSEEALLAAESGAAILSASGKDAEENGSEEETETEEETED